MRTLFTVTLPLPDRRLSPNARVHHMTLASLKKHARAASRKAAFLIFHELGSIPTAPTHYGINWYYKGIKPDDDNCLASCKAALDGIADYLGVNDKDLKCHYIKSYKDKTNPRLEITYFAQIRLSDMTRPELAEKLLVQLRKACETWVVLDHRIYEGELLDITMTLNTYLKAATSHTQFLTDELADLETNS